jgi:hypothetical protein
MSSIQAGARIPDDASLTETGRLPCPRDSLAGVIKARPVVHNGLRLTCQPTLGIDYASGSAGILDLF